jgi:hypothetical protein
MSVRPEDYFLVTHIGVPYGKNNRQKTIQFRKSRDLQSLMKIRERMQNGEIPGWSFNSISGFLEGITKTRFDYRFDIIEPGFPINESVRFHRGQDPKRALRIGERTWEKLRPGDILIPKRDFKIDRYGTPMPPSRKGGQFYYGEGDLHGGKSILVVVKVRQSSVFSSARPDSQIVNGLEITSYETWNIDEALKVREQIENGTFDVDVFRKPIKASIPALKSRLDIYEG